MNTNYMKIEMQSKEENISAIRVCVTTFISNMDIHVDELMDIKTALSEAVTNAIDHAYENDNSSNKVVVQVEILDNEEIKIIVEDSGKGIEDISLAMTPAYTSKPEEEHAGLGFTIMESFMDEVIVDSKKDVGTTITLTKKIRNRKTKVA